MTEPIRHRESNVTWRWLRRLGVVLIGLGGLVSTFLVVENRRGREVWETYLREARAEGEDLEIASYIPPAVADAENMALAPFFLPLYNYTREEVRDSGTIAWRTTWHNPAAKDAVRNVRWKNVGKKVLKANWRKGEQLDFSILEPEIRRQPSFPKGAPTGTPAEDLLQYLAEFQAPLAEVQEASRRPAARFPLHYGENIFMEMPHLIVTLNLVNLLRLRSVAELQVSQPEPAAADVLLAFRLRAMMAQEPLLMPQMVKLANLENSLVPVWEGLSRHAWSEEQITSFAQALAAVRPLPEFALALRGERAFMIPLMTREGSRRWLGSMLHLFSGSALLEHPSLLPAGWFDQNRATAARDYQNLLDTADLQQERIDPRAVDLLEKTSSTATEGFQPYTMLAHLGSEANGAFAYKSARAQGTALLAGIALALERHWLRHGLYPVTLAALDADLHPPGDTWPSDPASGHPPHYHPLPNGQFLLYYDWWNGSDDGGLNLYESSPPSASPPRGGDLVWPQAKLPGGAKTP